MNTGDNFGGFMFFSEERPQHPQFDILKRHIERCVQDVFLEALRTQPPELCFVFDSEEQIDSFVSRILSYWEESENFEICQEVIDLTKIFKEKWNNRQQLDSKHAVARIIDIFGAAQK